MPWLDDESPDSSVKSAVHIIVRGRVQGVGFRWWTLSSAGRHGVCGFVGNRPDGSVEIFAEGDGRSLDLFTSDVKAGPPLSRVESVEAKSVPPRGFRDFTVTGF